MRNIFKLAFFEQYNPCNNTYIHIICMYTYLIFIFSLSFLQYSPYNQTELAEVQSVTPAQPAQIGTKRIDEKGFFDVSIRNIVL